MFGRLALIGTTAHFLRPEDGGGGLAFAPPPGDVKPPAGDGKPSAGDGNPPPGDGKPPAGDGKPPTGDVKLGADGKWWGDDWRDRIAGTDKGWKNELDRYTDPNAALKAAREIVKKVDAGELKAPPKPPPENATDEQMAAWRKEQGLPDKPEGYVAAIKLDAGMVIGEADKPVLNSFAAAAAKAGMQPAAFNEAVRWYYQNLAEQGAKAADAQLAKDGETLTATVAALKTEWGEKFEPHSNAIKNALGTFFPSDFAQALLDARLPDGTRVVYHPGFGKGMAAMALKADPALADLKGEGGGAPAGDAARHAEIRAMLSSPQGSDAYRRYWGNNAEGEALRKEFGELSTKLAAAKGKAAA